MKITATRLLTTALISSAVAMLGGCSSGMMKPPKGSPTMAQVSEASANSQSYFYDGKGDSAQASDSVMRAARAYAPKSGYNFSGESDNGRIVNSLNDQFPTLPNPQNLMYIFGHFAGKGQLPVPGHFVAFPMYNQTHYALPNEVQKPFNDGQFN